MASSRRIIHTQSDTVLIPRAHWCDSFWTKFRGLSFRRRLDAGEGIVLVERKDSRMNTAIHMLFVFFDLGVIWVNSGCMVVDKVLARPWRLSYTPKAAAQYVIESDPAILEQVSIGDHIQFETVQGG